MTLVVVHRGSDRNAWTPRSVPLYRLMVTGSYIITQIERENVRFWSLEQKTSEKMKIQFSPGEHRSSSPAGTPT